MRAKTLDERMGPKFLDWASAGIAVVGLAIILCQWWFHVTMAAVHDHNDRNLRRVVSQLGRHGQ